MMKKGLLQSIMTYGILLLALLLFDSSQAIQTRIETVDKMNTTAKDILSLPLNLAEDKNSPSDSDTEQVFTAGNTMCRPNKVCGYDQDTEYKWCYTDYSNNWDYCCTGHCLAFQNTKYLWCKSGKIWQYCGDGGYKDIQDRPCLKTHKCGMHGDNNLQNYYWCYVDLYGTWGKCCAPWHHCTNYGESYNWCYTGLVLNTQWQNCEPP